MKVQMMFWKMKIKGSDAKHQQFNVPPWDLIMPFGFKDLWIYDLNISDKLCPET